MKTKIFLLAGLAVALSVLLASAQGRSSAPTQSTAGAVPSLTGPTAAFGPHARDIFLLTDHDFPPSLLTNGGGGYFMGAVVTIYTVPADKWLVLTELRVVGNVTAGPMWEVLEVQGSTTVKRRMTDPRFSTPIGYPLGVTFAPGSSVVFRCRVYQSWIPEFLLAGYLVRD